MKAKEVHALSDKDLEKQLKDGRAELFNLRFQMATSQLDNTARVCAVKKDIARVQTEMRLRELAAEKGASQKTEKAKKPAAPKAEKSEAKADTKPAENTAVKAEEKAGAKAEEKVAADDSKKVAGA